MDLSKATVMVQRHNKTLYRDGNRTIKLMNAEYNASDVLNEALNQSIVQETGFKVPELFEVTKIDGRWAIILEHIEGKTLAEMIKESPPDKERLFERFVDIHCGMHTYKAERLRHLTDKMHNKISNSGLERSIRYELHTRLESLPKHTKLCHGDFVLDNVIITPSDEVYVLDWSHATQGNASADAARTYLRFELMGEHDSAEKFMSLFCEKSGTERQYVQKWLAIVAASQLVKSRPEEHDFLTRWASVVEY